MMEYLGGVEHSGDDEPIPGWMRSPVLWGLWWGVLILLMLAFCGQTSKFLYVDF